MKPNKISLTILIAIFLGLSGCLPAKSVSKRSNSTQTPIQSTVTAKAFSPTIPSARRQVATPTQLPQSTKTKSSYCEQLARSYLPPAGFQTYCNPDYLFAFDYPADWKISLYASSLDNATSSPLWIRTGQMLAAVDMSNYIRVDTYHLYQNMTLSERVQNYSSFKEREFANKDYPSLRIGGQRAYAIINRWHQDISGVTLFFQYGDHYTAMELKAPNRTALQTNWKIAQSLQVPGSNPAENVIPDDLIQDSHQLLQ